MMQNKELFNFEIKQSNNIVVKTKKPTVVSLFAGAGGMDLGFKKAGFDIVFANDFNEDACKTYSNNIDKHIFCGDVSKIANDDIPKNVDILIGGFPCQGFSIANKNRNMQDERNALYKEMIRFIEVSQPKIFVAENVKGLLSMEGGEIIKIIIEDFKKIGYDVDFQLMNTAYFGVPQFRERVIIMGNKIGVKNRFPQKTHGIDGGKPFINVKDVCGYLQYTDITYNPITIGKHFLHDPKFNEKQVYNHIASTNVHDKFWARKSNVKQEEICDYLKEWRKKSGISTHKIDEIFGYRHTAGHWFRKDNNSGSIPKPNDWIRLKEILKFDDKYDKAITELEERQIVFEQSLRITNWDTPSDTITATSPEIHINKQRRLSVRECAIIQTFPDDFVFYGSLNSMYRQIGNAVPVEFAKLIAECVKEMLYDK